MNYVTHPLRSVDINNFSLETCKFCYIYKYKILSRDSNYIAAVVMWAKFGKSSIGMREVN